MKKYLIWLLVVVIISTITACEGKIKSQPVPNVQVTADTDTAKAKDIKSVKTTPSNGSSDNHKSLKKKTCQRALEDLGQFSEKEGRVDYESGFRIFPLLNFIMTKKSIPANHLEQTVFMKDNPIFVTRNDKHENSLVFATIHSQRTGVLQGVVGFPDNEVTRYYESMVFGEGTPQVPATDIGPLNKSVDVNRETWGSELAEYTGVCKEPLILPPTKTERPFFDYNGAIFPFSKEIDFVAGAEGVGFGLLELGNRYPDGKKIQIPILVYSPKGKVENVVMIQDGIKLTFTEDENNRDWQKWLGKNWYAFTSEEIDFDENVFIKADFPNIHSDLPPFISENESTIQVTINGEKVEYVNH